MINPKIASERMIANDEIAVAIRYDQKYLIRRIGLIKRWQTKYEKFENVHVPSGHKGLV